MERQAVVEARLRERDEPAGRLGRVRGVERDHDASGRSSTDAHGDRGGRARLPGRRARHLPGRTPSRRCDAARRGPNAPARVTATTTDETTTAHGAHHNGPTRLPGRGSTEVPGADHALDRTGVQGHLVHGRTAAATQQPGVVRRPACPRPPVAGDVAHRPQDGGVEHVAGRHVHRHVPVAHRGHRAFDRPISPADSAAATAAGGTRARADEHRMVATTLGFRGAAPTCSPFRR